MNEYLIRNAIEKAPLPNDATWGMFVREAVKAWDNRDWKQLRDIGNEVIQERPCIPWDSRIKDLITEMERSGLCD